MRVILLTTETPHHLFYAWQMAKSCELDAIFVEAGCAPFAFPVKHPYEDVRDRYEQDVLLAGVPKRLESIAPVLRFANMNHPPAIAALRAKEPDVVLVFGTGKLLPEIVAVPKWTCLNLHGGNPETYRGLDSHLWAIYHGDFENLVTTLHLISPELDAGDIVMSTSLPIYNRAELHQLRAINTQSCVDMSSAALAILRSGGRLPTRRQLARGRYYSAMPAVLKDICVAKFLNYTANL